FHPYLESFSPPVENPQNFPQKIMKPQQFAPTPAASSNSLPRLGFSNYTLMLRLVLELLFKRYEAAARRDYASKTETNRAIARFPLYQNLRIDAERPAWNQPLRNHSGGSAQRTAGSTLNTKAERWPPLLVIHGEQGYEHVKRPN